MTKEINIVEISNVVRMLISCAAVNAISSNCKPMLNAIRKIIIAKNEAKIPFSRISFIRSSFCLNCGYKYAKQKLMTAIASVIKAIGAGDELAMIPTNSKKPDITVNKIPKMTNGTREFPIFFPPLK
jgi:C4-type Zn-finger protein